MCYSEEARAKGVVVGWEPKEREETIYHYPSYGGDLMANDAAPGTSTQGVNGSMARFSIYGKYLYTVEQNIMCVFDLSGDKPVLTTNDIGCNVVSRLFSTIKIRCSWELRPAC